MMRYPDVRTLLTSTVAVYALAVAAPAQAQTKSFNVPAQSAATGIPELARQADVQILVSESAARGKTTRAVKGSMTVDKALRRLLEGTGLRVSSSDGRTFTLVSGVSDGTTSWGEAQADSIQTEASADIVVTGSRLSGIVNPALKTYSSQEINRSGQSTVNGFLNQLPQVSVSSVGNPLTSYGGQTTVRLRGFPVGTTLVLLNGRPLQLSGISGSYFDLNAIPASVVDHIDVLPTGSSAVYGSNAMAGVVNINTKRDFKGVSADASYGGASHYDEQTYTLAGGTAWSGGNITAVATYDRNGPLKGFNRAATSNQDRSQFAALGGVDRRVLTCSPGNVSSTDGSNLPGFTSSSAGVNLGVLGKPSISDFTAGVLNKCSSTISNVSFVQPAERYAFLTSIKQSLGDEVSVFSDLMYSHLRNNGVFNGSSITSVVPSTNAFNPFGKAVNVQYLIPVDVGRILNTDFLNGVVGLNGRLSKSWSWEMSGTASADLDKFNSYGNRNSSALSTALASSDPNTALNPFSSAVASPSVFSNIFYTTHTKSRSVVAQADFTVKGSLLELPAGEVKVAVGGSFGAEWMKSETLETAGSLVSYSRRKGAGYLEVHVPLLGRESYQAGEEYLGFTSSARVDDYSGFGAHFTQQHLVEWRPFAHLVITGSYATSFKAPNLSDLYGATTKYQTSVVDKGVATPLVVYTYGGNPSLKPESGEFSSIEAAWSPPMAKGLKLSSMYWTIAQNNRVTGPTPQTLVDYPDLFPGRVVRDAAGDIQSINGAPVNFGSLRASGFDVAAQYEIATNIGTFATSADFTIFTKYTAAIAPGQPQQDRLNKATVTDAWAPKYKGSFQLGWSKSGINTSVTGRYIGRYLDYQTPINNNYLGGYVLFDGNIRIDLKRVGIFSSNMSRGVYLNISVVNLLDRGPQYSNATSGILGYDPSQYDIIGRTVRATVGVTF